MQRVSWGHQESSPSPSTSMGYARTPSRWLHREHPSYAISRHHHHHMRFRTLTITIHCPWFDIEDDDGSASSHDDSSSDSVDDEEWDIREGHLRKDYFEPKKAKRDWDENFTDHAHLGDGDNVEKHHKRRRGRRCKMMMAMGLVLGVGLLATIITIIVRRRRRQRLEEDVPVFYESIPDEQREQNHFVGNIIHIIVTISIIIVHLVIIVLLKPSPSHHHWIMRNTSSSLSSSSSSHSVKTITISHHMALLDNAMHIIIQSSIISILSISKHVPFLVGQSFPTYLRPSPFRFLNIVDCFKPYRCCSRVGWFALNLFGELLYTTPSINRALHAFLLRFVCVCICMCVSEWVPHGCVYVCGWGWGRWSEYKRVQLQSNHHYMCWTISLSIGYK